MNLSWTGAPESELWRRKGSHTLESHLINEITTRVHEERKHNISFFSIPAQFPLNAFFLRFSYAYPTAEQYHTGTTC